MHGLEIGLHARGRFVSDQAGQELKGCSDERIFAVGAGRTAPERTNESWLRRSNDCWTAEAADTSTR